jgi:hypothetical protein
MSVKAIGVACVVIVLAVAAMAQEAPPQGGERGPGGRGMRDMQGRGTFGVITAISGDTLTLEGREGKTETVKVTSATNYRREGQDAKFADFKVGDRVGVMGEQKDGVWVAQMVGSGRPGAGGQGGRAMMNPEDMGKKFIAGEITKIDETKLTVHRIDGQDQVIEVDETTSFRNNKRESITLADVKVGDKVMGRGDMKGEMFVPTMLNVGDFPQRFGPGGPRREGQSGEKDQTQAPPKQ